MSSFTIIYNNKTVKPMPTQKPKITVSKMSYFGGGLYGSNTPTKPMNFGWLNRPVGQNFGYYYGNK